MASSDVDLTPFYRDLLLRTTPVNSSSVSDCVITGWFHNLGVQLSFDSIRLYLYRDDTGCFVEHHIFGSKDYWKGLDITRFRKEKAKFKNLFFVKIKHIRENGQVLILGYMAFHTEQYVSTDLLDRLEVLCMLYGNYIVKRVVGARMEKVNHNLLKAYDIAASSDLPGTKILHLSEVLQHLAGYNRGVFCTVCGNMVTPEYSTSNKGANFPRKHVAWRWSDELINAINTTFRSYHCSISELPRNSVGFILYKDARCEDDFNCTVYPIYVDEELIGVWIFVRSKNNPFNQFDAKDVLDNLYPSLIDSYKFLFQRRYNQMVVNPIFQNRDTRVINDSVFVIMPFTADWSKDIWEQVIKPAVRDVNMNPVRADDLYGANIMEDVWQSILKAAIIICDTTGRNPNVFYELGIAHTLGKKVILLTQNVDDIPFDLQAYRHIKYDTTITGGNLLKEGLKNHIKELLK